MVILIQINYVQIAHFSGGFIRDPMGHLKTSLNKLEFIIIPSTLKPKEKGHLIMTSLTMAYVNP
jgi:hypothetical protein